MSQQILCEPNPAKFHDPETPSGGIFHMFLPRKVAKLISYMAGKIPRVFFIITHSIFPNLRNLLLIDAYFFLSLLLILMKKISSHIIIQ